MVTWLQHVYNDSDMEITMTLVAAFGAFMVANNILMVTGVLAVVALGLMMAAMGKHFISRSVEHPLRYFW